MYDSLKSLVLRLMKAPTQPPDAPAGSHDSVQIYRASPRFLSYRMLGFWIVFTALWGAWWVLLLAGILSQELAAVAIIVPLGPILLLGQFFAYFAIRIDYDMRYYIVTDRSLRVREGAVIVKEKTISHANVQNVRVVQGPILRLFGIWKLEVSAAGGGGSGPSGEKGHGHQIDMDGIENAHEVRNLILEHLRLRGRGSGLGDLDDADEHARTPLASQALLEAVRTLRDSSAALHRACNQQSAVPPGDPVEG